MCFSANASFAGGLIISTIGVITVREVHKPSQIIFASIPLFFGLQQIVEGVLWITLPIHQFLPLQKFATYFFLMMADVIWPMLIPISVLFMETNKKKKKAIWVFLALGLSLSAYYGWCLIFYNVNPQIIGYHIKYLNDFPTYLANPAFVVYLAATITPLFISSIKRTHLLGILMFLSCLITAIFFRQYLTSVWCFFAALISAVIFWILRDSKKKFKIDKLELLKAKLKSVTG